MNVIILMVMLWHNTNLNPLAEYRWKNRIVVIYAHALNDARYVEQSQLLQNQGSELEERDLLVFTVTDNNKIFEQIYGQMELNEGVSRAIKEKYFKVGKSEIILIGKDGGVKLRSATVVKPGELYALIDTMPMRRAEMR